MVQALGNGRDNGARQAAKAQTRPKVADPVPDWRGKITSRPGHRNSPGGIGSTNHQGLDVGVPMGTPIQAAKDGVVVSAGNGGGYGNLTVIKHDDGTFTKYAHQSAINVQPGQEVKAGDVIGKVGSTGNSTGPHLHFEVRRGDPNNGEVLDPVDYLDGAENVRAVDPGGGQSFADSGSDTNAVGGGGSPSGMSLGGGGSAGSSSGGAPSGAASGGGGAAAPSASTAVGSGAPVAKGDFSAMLKKLEGFGIDRAYLEELAKKHGVPLEVILAIMMQESGGDPNAKSGAGAMGLMQLMPGTAAGLGVTNPLDPKQNLEAGVKYLAQMHKNPRAGGDWGKAFAMYNAGPAGNFNNAETQGYIKSVPQLVQQAKTALNV